MPLLAETTFKVFGTPVDAGVFWLWVLAALAVGLGVRWLKGRLDRMQITRDVGQGGGYVVSITWNPFGRGWFGERGERIYEVTYCTREGRIVTATCKTSLFSGVYWTR